MMFIGSASLAGGTILAVGLGAARRGDSGPDDVDESIDCRGGRVASRSEGVNATAGQFLGTNVLSYRAPASAASATKPEIRSSSCRCNCEPPRCGAAPPQSRRRRGGGASDTCPHTFAGRIADEQSACPHRARQPAASRAMLPDQGALAGMVGPRTRQQNGRQRWIRAVDLRPAAVRGRDLSLSFVGGRSPSAVGSGNRSHGRTNRLHA